MLAMAWSWIEHRLVSIHQRSVTKSIERWGEEYSDTSRAGPARSAEMLDYIEHYYVPGPGYKGTPDVEAALQKARVEAMEKIRRRLELSRGTNGP
jgi:hypothetical protein